MTIYIHGFSGSGEGAKAKAFRKHYKSSAKSFIAPSLSYIPELAIMTLEEIIENSTEEITLIGSSLGGFYAIYLANKYNLKAVLLNPSIFPYKTLLQYKGDAINFYDNTTFKWTQEHIDMLHSYNVKDVKEENFMLLVQMGDELLNPTDAIDKFKKATTSIEEGGNHSFTHIEKHFKNIDKFLYKSL